MNSITVKVPASTSNLGPGFDTLGIALKLYNYVRIIHAEGKGMDIVSPIEETNRAGAIAMLNEAADAFFRAAGKKPRAADVAIRGDVPMARGLGSSVTARLGVVAGLNELTKARLTREAILEIVAALEHHPDNAAPAVFGGFTVAGLSKGGVRCLAFPVPRRARFVALIPAFEISTERARRLVPSHFTKSDTVHNLNRAALISAAFAAGNLEDLRGLFDDRVHQPYRRKLIPELFKVIEAGERAGAIGGWLSGSGSTIICLALEKIEAIGRAMKKELPHSRVLTLEADPGGFRVVKS